MIPDQLGDGGAGEFENVAVGVDPMHFYASPDYIARNGAPARPEDVALTRQNTVASGRIRTFAGIRPGSGTRAPSGTP